MCTEDALFCIFYYLGFIAVAFFFSAGIYIIFDWMREKEE